MNIADLERLIASAASASDRDRNRLRKFVTVSAVVVVACVAAIAAQLAQGAYLSALETGSVLVVSAGTLLALRWGVSLGVAATAYLFLGVGVAGLMGLQGGPNGMISVYWMSAAPLIALTIGGRRAGFVTLAFTIIIMVSVLYCIDEGITPPTVLMEDAKFGVRTASMLGAVVTLFLLVLAYERETERNIVGLEEKNQALNAAREDADRASRAKSDFLATISHEIRTPLNGVSGMITLLQDEPDLARVREGMRIIRQSADTLLAVINDVLDFSKIESNSLELESASVCLRVELQLVVDLMQVRAAERNIELELAVESQVPEWIWTDPTRFRQIALNLIANAVKFTEAGSVVCRLGMNDGWLSLEIKDTGIGMSAVTLGRLFRPFMQADASTTRRFGGTGLGLVITERLVRALGGNISAESELGVGSRFVVKLPVKAAEAPPVMLESQQVGPARRILLVEDNSVNQLVAKRLLERAGHSVAMAADGQQAVTLCESERFDVILMDCHMPVLDGYQATRELRSRGIYTPIYALTAGVTSDDHSRCFSSGMDAVVTKPLRLERLHALLRDLPTAPQPKTSKTAA